MNHERTSAFFAASRLRARLVFRSSLAMSDKLWLAHIYPHRFWLALLATRLSRESVKSLNGQPQRAGEFDTRALIVKLALKPNSLALILLPRVQDFGRPRQRVDCLGRSNSCRV